MPPIALKAVQKLILKALPNLSADDREIIISISAAQLEGSAINMKQLVISQRSTATTIRRRVAHLIGTGHLVKHLKEGDGRSYTFSVSKPVMTRLAKLSDALRQLVTELDGREHPGDRG
jgi:hypothetical protein